MKQILLRNGELTVVEVPPPAYGTRTYGQNLKVAGLTQFSVMLSDSHGALTNVKLGASFECDPPIVMFDELSVFPTVIFWTLLLLPISAVIIFAFQAREAH